MEVRSVIFGFFFFNDTATTEIYTLSLHDALPIFFSDINKNDISLQQLAASIGIFERPVSLKVMAQALGISTTISLDRKSTRLNSSHANISYAVFCLKKKKKNLIHFSPNIQNNTPL